jgi:hypothetical protein
MKRIEDMSRAELRKAGIPLATPAEPELQMACLARVHARQIRWLWPGRLALGKLHVLAGAGGQGKSTLLCDIAARVTAGRDWPDGAAGSPPGSVVIVAAEDDASDTLKPRLVAAGADLERIFIVQSVRSGADGTLRCFSLRDDLHRLEQRIVDIGDVALVVIDPVSSCLGRIDGQKYAQVRALLEPLGEVARRWQVAVLCNHHFSKGGGSAQNRVVGSAAFVHQARAAFVVVPDAESPGRRFFAPAKLNLAPMPDGLAYRIEGVRLELDTLEVAACRIAWEPEPVTVDPDAALAALSTPREDRTLKAEAMALLRAGLKDGPCPAQTLAAAARAAGIPAKPLRSARQELGVVTTKSGFGLAWIWSLPDASEEAAHG